MKNRDDNLLGLPYLSKGKMLAFNIGCSYLEQPVDVVVLLVDCPGCFDQGGTGMGAELQPQKRSISRVPVLGNGFSCHILGD